MRTDNKSPNDNFKARNDSIFSLDSSSSLDRLAVSTARRKSIWFVGAIILATLVISVCASYGYNYQVQPEYLNPRLITPESTSARWAVRQSADDASPLPNIESSHSTIPQSANASIQEDAMKATSVPPLVLLHEDTKKFNKQTYRKTVKAARQGYTKKVQVKSLDLEKQGLRKNPQVKDRPARLTSTAKVVNERRTDAQKSIQIAPRSTSMYADPDVELLEGILTWSRDLDNLR